jgi:uncharacterized protein involved in exopolysaccharide biosynthesis
MNGERSVPSPASTDQQKSSVLARLWRVPVVTLLCLIGGGVYIVRAKPIYSASAVLSVRDAAAEKQTGAIRSAATGIDDPTGRLKSELRIVAVGDSNLIRLTFDADDPKLAAQLVNGVVDAYVNRPPPAASTTQSADPATVKLFAEQQQRRAEITEFKKNNPDLATDPGKALSDRIASLVAAITAAQIEASGAKSAFETTIPMLQDPAKAANLIEANRHRGIFDSLDRETRQIRDELAAAEDVLVQQKKSMLAQNPNRVATEKKVQEIQERLATQQQRYVEVYRTVLEQQWQTALRKQEDLQRILDQQRDDLKGLSAKMTQLGQLEANLKNTNAELERVTGEAVGEPVHVQILQAAQAPIRPSWPDRTKVMWAALTCGVAAGLLASLIRVGDA